MNQERIFGGDAGSWYDPKILGKTSKTKYVNMGNHNRVKFHDKYFKNSKTPIEVHVLYCHTQYDCDGADKRDARF